MVALDLRLLTGTLFYGGIEGLLQEVTRRLRACGAEKLRLHILDDGAVAVQNLLHHMWLVVAATVDDAAVRSRHLNHGDVKVLAEGVGREGRTSHVFCIVHEVRGVGLCRQIDAGILTEAEDMLVLHEVLGTFIERGIHKVYVTGLREPHRGIEHAVTVSVMTADTPGMDTVVQLDVALTVEGRVRCDGLLLQCTGDRDALRYRTRLIGIGYRDVSPHLVPCDLTAIGQDVLGRIVLRHLILCDCGGIRILSTIHADGLLAAELHEILIGIDRAVQRTRIVQVKLIGGAHREHLAGIRIHDDRRRHLRAHIFCLPLVEVLLQRHLNIRIDGRHDGITVGRLLQYGLQLRIAVEVAVLPAIDAHQSIVVVLLDATGSAGAVGTREADDVAGEGIVRIGTLVLILEPDALDACLRATADIRGILLLHIRFPGRFLVVAQSLRILHIGLVGLFAEQLSKLGLIIFEAGDERLNRRIHITLILTGVDDTRVDDQVIYLLAGRQHRAVPVHDVTAAERNRT